MNKSIVLCTLLSAIGIVNCEENVSQRNQRSAYQDYKKVEVLNIKKLDSVMELANLTDKLRITGLRLEVVMRACEEAGDCETSEDFRQIFLEFAKNYADLFEASDALRNSSETQQMEEILKKY